MWLLCFEIHIDARVICSVQVLIKFTSGRVGQEKKVNSGMKAADIRKVQRRFYDRTVFRSFEIRATVLVSFTHYLVRTVLVRH
jgi:hypothetical protein